MSTCDLLLVYCFSINENRPLKFFGVKEFTFLTFDIKNGCKNEFKDNYKNHAADAVLGFLTKSISKPYGRETAMPTSWALIHGGQMSPPKKRPTNSSC